MTILPGPLPRHTYADYRAWPAEIAGELIDGLFHDRTPETPEHDRVVGALRRQLQAGLCGQREAALASSIDVLPLLSPDQFCDDATCVVRPDVFIVCDRSRLKPDYVWGAPEVVVEVVSPATARKDHLQKLALYEAAGVAEYWLLHPQDRVVTIYTRADDRHYDRPQILPAEGSVPLKTLPKLSVDFDSIFAA